MSDQKPISPEELQLMQLWQQAQLGDEQAYRQVLRQLALRLRQFLRSRMQSQPDDLEDLVQDTLMAIHIHRDSHDPAVPITAWAHSIARHKLIDRWRAHGRRNAVWVDLDDEALAQVAEPEREAMSTTQDLQQLLALVTPAQRQALVLTKLEGLSVAEAAARTGSSESAIKVQVHRGLKRLSLLVGASSASPHSDPSPAHAQD